MQEHVMKLMVRMHGDHWQECKIIFEGLKFKQNA
jgi:hypothetical protein